MAKYHPVDFTIWLDQLTQERGLKEVALLKTAIDLYSEKQSSFLNSGLGVAAILHQLGLDSEALTAAIIFPAVKEDEIHIDKIAELLGEGCAKLIQDVKQMEALGKLRRLDQRRSHQLENLRKMLLAIVSDIRAVLITLAQRLWQLRNASAISSEEQIQLAQETLYVYAPLANRLGIGQLKWELEDLSLRYLEPEIYKQIAKWLASRRDERENYIKNVIAVLEEALKQNGIQDFQISGRVKHIYSIYRKMRRKSSDYSEIYDVSAVRVLVASIADCYVVLSIVHQLWKQIPKEFDDYIAHPKTNGYRSIHTAVIGPDGYNVEVQIRTQQMHQEAELGLAAHWRYKEGGKQKANYEEKIAWLRQVMEWQKEVTKEISLESNKQQTQDLFADRIYVFTPTGDIVDLPQGATPLDFAYHIHSEVGHRCRGAKVNGNIVPLTYGLRTGERIEILTAKQPNPSRDWLNTHLAYLKTQRARAKVQHWFKAQDHAQHVAAGHALFEKELRRLGLGQTLSLEDIAEKLNYKSSDDLLAALGLGDIRIAQILHCLQPSEADAVIASPLTRAPTKKKLGDIQIIGVGNLLTQMARCCKPLPGEPIIGFITRGRGVSVHRQDCTNILHANENTKKRFIEVNWGEKVDNTYPVDLYLEAYDRQGLLRDITTMLATEKINLLEIQTQTDKNSHKAHVYLTIEIANLAILEKILDRLQHIPNILLAERQSGMH